MTKRITLDSSVLQYCFVPPEVVEKRREEEWNTLHPRAKMFWDAIIRGQFKLISPFIVLAEISIVYSRVKAAQYKTKSEQREITKIIEQAKEIASNRLRSNEWSIYRLEDLVSTANEAIASNENLLVQAISLAADDQGQQIVDLICSTCSELPSFDRDILPTAISMATLGQLRTADACIMATSLQTSSILVTADNPFYDKVVKHLKNLVPNVNSRIINFRTMSDEEVRSFLAS